MQFYEKHSHDIEKSPIWIARDFTTLPQFIFIWALNKNNFIDVG